MEKLTTAMGKTIDCDYFNPFAPANQITIRVYNITLVDTAAIFSNPEETAQLFWCGQCVTNYSKVVALVPEADSIRVVMGKE